MNLKIAFKYANVCLEIDFLYLCADAVTPHHYDLLSGCKKFGVEMNQVNLTSIQN